MASWYSMRFAIVDDLDTERTLLKERLARQLRQRGTEAELLEFDSGEAFLAAEKERRFTAALPLRSPATPTCSSATSPPPRWM